ncbi:MAG: ABC transporter permease [Planctomycetota bacterium]
MAPTALSHVSPKLVIPLAVLLAIMVLCWLVGKVPIGYNLRNLLVRWKTTIMTGMAFTLVVSLLTVMLAFVNGMYKMTEESGQPGNVVILSDGAVDELFSNLSFSDSSDLAQQPGILRDESEKPLCSWEVYLVVNQPIPKSAGRNVNRRFVQVRGIDDPVISGKVHGLELFEGGQWFSNAGVQELPAKEGEKGSEQAIQAVLGQGVAQVLGEDQGKIELQPGDTFELGGRKWIVVGVMKSAGSTFGSEIWAKRSIVGPMFGKETYTSVVARTADAASAQTLANELTTNFKKSALQAQTETEYFSKLSETNRQFLVAILFVAVVMAIGGVFGVMNTMFAAISQRTKDIGVLRVLGYKRWQILVSFLLESMVLALIGGAIGCAVGMLADGWTATSIVSGGQGGGGKSVILELTVDTNTILLGLLLTLTMGLLGGLVPALSAMRLKPLESLR